MPCCCHRRAAIAVISRRPARACTLRASPVSAKPAPLGVRVRALAPHPARIAFHSILHASLRARTPKRPLLVLHPCASAGTYSLRRRSSVPGNDVDCNYKDWQGKLQPYCRVSGDLAGAAAACSANPGCRAFDMADESTAYLKTAAAPSEYTEGSNTFAKAA